MKFLFTPRFSVFDVLSITIGAQLLAHDYWLAAVVWLVGASVFSACAGSQLGIGRQK